MLSSSTWASPACRWPGWLSRCSTPASAAWLTRRRLALLLIEPLITLLLVFTNTAHGLIWSSVGTAGELMPLPVEHGPWFWVHVASSYVLMLLGSILLVQAIVRSPTVYRRQAAALLVGAAAPWLGNALYVFRQNPLHPLDLTPAGFALSALAVGWALFRYPPARPCAGGA